MRARTKRLVTLAAAGVVLAGAAGLALAGLSSTMTYYYEPSDVVARGGVTPGQAAKLGGLVEPGSVVFHEDGRLTFDVRDEGAEIAVTYKNIVPDLFREGQGVIVEGVFTEAGTFDATRVLAKHDENYIPRELQETLKNKHDWRNTPLETSTGSGSY